MKKENLKVLNILLHKLDKRSMSIPTIHGYLSAIVIGPEVIQPSQWLPLIFNPKGEMPVYDSHEEADLLISSIMYFYNSIIQDIDADKFKPIFSLVQNSKQKRTDPHEWCKGFAKGVALSDARWRKAKDEALFSLVMPIFYFVDREGFKFPFEDASEEKKKEFEINMISMIPKAVPALRNYWREKIYGNQAIKPKGRIIPFGKGVQREPGRNDPCPCGSGKKYKMCCGK